MTQSDYIVYVDESGDHGLQSISPEYPMFVLAFCIFSIQDYVQTIAPAIQQLKFKYFGHDMVVLHEREIHKCEGVFSILMDRTIRDKFMADLSKLVEESTFTIVSVVIRKYEFLEQHPDASNPYHTAMKFGLERIHKLLYSKG